MGSRRKAGTTLPPVPVGSVEPIVDEAPANQPTPLPYWAKNRVQRVPDRACPLCGGPVLRAPRGPAPRCCVACEIALRRVRQLRAYLRAAERLAASLGRPEVAEAARVATTTLDMSGAQP
jgi:hypothetical protein